jgi:hypothetical protein
VYQLTGVTRHQPLQAPQAGGRRARHRRPGRPRQLTLVLVIHDTTITRRARRVTVMTNGHLTARQDSPNP